MPQDSCAYLLEKWCGRTIEKKVHIPVQFPPQHQPWQPGLEWLMCPKPLSEQPGKRGYGKLSGKTALITGGDSGIGRAVALSFAKEGADIGIIYLSEHRDAWETKQRIETFGKRCITIATDLGSEQNARRAVFRMLAAFGKVDILVNNCAEQHLSVRLESISSHQLVRTFQTNLFSYFYVTKALVPYLGCGSSIINTASVTAYEGHPWLIDYAATKGAIVAFTRSLAKNLIPRGIRVNGVAPGPVWTPLIVSSFPPQDVMIFGADTPYGRAAQPYELAPAYVYLASQDSSYVTGQMIHVNGGSFLAS